MRESLLGRDVGSAQLLAEFAHEKARIAALVAHDLPRWRGEEDQRTFGGIDRGKACGRRTKASFERIVPGRIDNGDLDPCTAPVHLAEDRIEIDAVTPHLRLRPDLCVYGEQEALPSDLDSISPEIDQGGGACIELCIEGIEDLLAVLLF